jgi:hypothetical protein
MARRFSLKTRSTCQKRKGAAEFSRKKRSTYQLVAPLRRTALMTALPLDGQCPNTDIGGGIKDEFLRKLFMLKEIRTREKVQISRKV